MIRVPLALSFLAFTAPAFAQDAPPRVDPTPPPPDKSVYTLFNPTPDSALRFSPDRPAKGVSPVTVDAGHVQYETDFLSYTHSNAGGTTTRVFTAFDPVLKLGITNRIDVELQFGGYNWVNAPGHARGAGDVYLRSKVNLFGNEGGPAMALVPYVKMPTASRNIGNGRWEGGIQAPITYPLPWDFTLMVMPEVDVLKNAADTGSHFNFTQLINISHPLGKSLTVSGELYSALGTDKRTPPVYTFDVALAWAVNDRLQLDVGANIGLNRDSPNLVVYSGIAQRF